MKKRASALIMAVIMVLTMIPAAFAEDEEQIVQLSSEWGSEYETTNEFTISSVADLLAFAQMVNDESDPKDFSGKTVTLDDDLDLSGVTWVPIGSTDSEDGSQSTHKFAGTFDGQNHSISNITLSYGIEDTDPVYDAGGLFGVVSGTIKNVKVVNIKLTAAMDNLGGIAGILEDNAVIENCSASGTISGAYYGDDPYGGNSGGIVGWAKGLHAKITDCESSVTVETDASNIGGIVGNVRNYITVQNCTNNGTVSGVEAVGGIVGTVGAYSSISDCTNNGTVTGASNPERRFGGIVGDSTRTTISGCTNNADIEVENATEVGGITGRAYADTSVTDCENTAAISGSEDVGGIVGSCDVDSGGRLGYTVQGCTNSGDVSGSENIGGIAGATGAFNKTNTTSPTGTIEISGCVNEGEVSGETNVGGIVGSHNETSNSKTDISQAATVSGCINTGAVSEDGGAIVGHNNDKGTTNGTSMPGIVQNNFFPESIGSSAVASGAGSSESESVDAVKNNSSYDEEGNLNDSVTNEEGNKVTTIADAVEQLLGGVSQAPEVLKVTATFDKNGHGTAQSTQEVVIGTEITLPSMSNDGYYTFLYWTIQGDSSNTQYNGNTKYTITANTTFVANWRDDTPASTPSGGSSSSSSSSTTYSVSVDTAKNGTVSVSPKNASKGTTVTITAKPNDGYEVDEVIVTDKNGDTVKVTAKGNDKYTFVMPAGKVDVEVTFVQEYVAPAISFTDVKSNAWYYDAALYAAENGLMSGTGNGAFSPDLTTSRAMIWTILARVDGQNISVTYGNWYDKAQAWAMAAGVSDGTNPDNPITREQLAVMLYGFAKDQGYTTTGGVSLSRYVDASDVSSWAVEALEWAVGNGLISSMGNNILAPTGTATRAQVAVILMNFCENIAK